MKCPLSVASSTPPVATANTGRNLVLCFDGTGNIWDPGAQRTNVVKLVEGLVMNSAEQLHYYDPGVGTPTSYLPDNTGLGISGWLLRWFGLAWGGGIWKNVSEGYRFLMQNYRIGDRIFVFGFSRGAFTARATAGLVDLCGLLRPEDDNLIPTVMAIYRAKESEVRKGAGQNIAVTFGIDPSPKIHFIGVWDTVESVGPPIPLLKAHITSDPIVKDSYIHVRHAVALDELREPYTPRLYTPPDPPLGNGRSFKQVWFCGAHADVGGGYAANGLSNAALHWMVREANAEGLLVDFAKLDRDAINALAPLHDQTVHVPWWTFTGICKRDYPGGPMHIHDTVVVRRNYATKQYRPPLPSILAIEHTRLTVTFANGTSGSRPVPTLYSVGNPSRESLSIGSVAWLVAAGLATVYAFTMFKPQSTALAHLQLLKGWNGGLGRLLQPGTDQMKSIGDLCLTLGKDSLFILLYGFGLLPFLARTVIRMEDPAGYPGKVGVWVGYSALLVPVSDSLENLFTFLTADLFNESHCCSNLFSVLASVGVSLMSALKFIALGALVLAVIYCVILGAFKWVSYFFADTVDA
jgi:uncharacterized protein (DUF2235 family)